MYASNVVAGIVPMLRGTFRGKITVVSALEGGERIGAAWPYWAEISAPSTSISSEMLGLPHAYEPSTALIIEARREGLGIGMIGKFMGTLNSHDVWEYETPEERREREQQSR